MSPSWMKRLSAPMARMRRGSRPSSPSEGTRSRKSISSSRLIGGLPGSWHQFVASGLGHQDTRAGGVALDLLPQAIDVRLEGVRGDAGIVTPHFLQQHLARHRPLSGAIEIAQDRGLLLGEADLVALGIEQDLRAGPEGIGPDGEHRVL